MIFRFGGIRLAFSGRLFFNLFGTFLGLPKNQHKMHPGPPTAAHRSSNGTKMVAKIIKK